MGIRAAAYVVNRFLLRRKHLVARAERLDLELRVRTEDVIGRHIYKYGSHEPATTEFLMRTLEFHDGDVALDVGANIGWYSLILDRIAGAARARIYAFEPDPENFALLEENVRRNGARRVHPVRRGAAEAAGTSALHLFGGANRGRHSMLPIHDGESIEIRTVSLDEFWAERALGERVPRFVKMDIEGYELAALKGARGLLSRCPLVMFEYSPRYMAAAGLAPAELLDLMLGHGYSPRVLEAGTLVAAEPAALLASDRHVDLFWHRP